MTIPNTRINVRNHAQMPPVHVLLYTPDSRSSTDLRSWRTACGQKSPTDATGKRWWAKGPVTDIPVMATCKVCRQHITDDPNWRQQDFGTAALYPVDNTMDWVDFVNLYDGVNVHCIDPRMAGNETVASDIPADELPIDSFDGEFRFLSNFYYPCWMQISGIKYPTVEHAYQACKTMDKEHRQYIADLTRPGDAKKEGRQVVLRDDWESIKLALMYDLVQIKFNKYPGLGDKLLATGNRPLVEGNWWRDFYWGVCNGKGENNLGQILMRVRKELADKRSKENTSCSDQSDDSPPWD